MDRAVVIVSYIVWGIASLSVVNGALRYFFPTSSRLAQAQEALHFLLDLVSVTVRADSTDTVSTLPFEIAERALSRAGQGTLKLPLVQRSAPPAVKPPALRLVPPEGDPPEGDPPEGDPPATKAVA